jgi:anti-sigma factor RsiW
MKISDETLLAYVDNELDAAARAEVEAAIAADPELARRVEQQRSLRKLLGAAYGPVLEEPVPPRLVAAAQAPRPAPAKAKVVELAAARESRRPPEGRAAWGWAQWGGMAACLVVGLVAGRGACAAATRRGGTGSSSTGP